MANLGFKMLSAGFFTEARAICDAALTVKDYHKNVGSLLVRLNDAEAEEDKGLDEAIEKGRTKVEFFRALGRALTSPAPTKLEGNWTSSECAVTLTVENGNVRVTGSYERPVGLPVVGMLSNRTVRCTIEYTGTLEGRAIFGRARKTDDGAIASATLLGQAGDQKALMYISEDGNEIIGIENPSSSHPTFLSIKRQTPPQTPK
jgi:hypothetical protein